MKHPGESVAADLLAWAFIAVFVIAVMIIEFKISL
jgi:hypothetical protein